MMFLGVPFNCGAFLEPFSDYYNLGRIWQDVFRFWFYTQTEENLLKPGLQIG